MPTSCVILKLHLHKYVCMYVTFFTTTYHHKTQCAQFMRYICHIYCCIGALFLLFSSINLLRQQFFNCLFFNWVLFNWLIALRVAACSKRKCVLCSTKNIEIAHKRTICECARILRFKANGLHTRTCTRTQLEYM